MLPLPPSVPLFLWALLLPLQEGKARPADPALPKHAVARLGTDRWRQGGLVNGVALSPDGRTALSASTNRMMTLWDVETGRRLHVFEGHTDEVCAVAFSPKGNLAVSSGHDRKWILWDLKTRAKLHVLEGESRGHGVAFSADGTRLLTAGDLEFILWEVATGKNLRTFKGHEEVVQCVEFATPGTIVSTSLDKSARVWNEKTGEELRRFTGHGAEVIGLAVSPDRRLAATGGEDHRIRIWEIQTGKEVRSMEGEHYGLNYLAFSGDGRRLLGSGEPASPAIWDVETGKQIVDFRGHLWPVKSAVFSADGKRVLSGSKDRTLILWDAATGKPLHEPDAPRSAIASLSLSPEGNALLVGGVDGTLALWDLKNGRRLQTAHESGAQIGSAVFTPDGRQILVGSNEGFLNVVDPRDLRRVQNWNAGGPIVSVTMSPDGSSFLAAGHAKTITLRKISTGEVLRNFEGHEKGVMCSAFRYDGRAFASGSNDGAILIWDTQDGTLLQKIAAHTGAVRSLAFNPTGLYLLSGSLDRTMALWEVGSGRKVRTFEGHEIGVAGVAFSPDGQHALSAGWDRAARLWDVATGAEVLRLEGHAGSLNAAAFTAGGRRIVTGSTDTSVVLWHPWMEETAAATAWARGLKAAERATAAQPLLEEFLTRDFRRWVAVRERLIALGEDGAKAVAIRFPPEQADPVALDATLDALLARLDADAVDVREAAWKELRAQQGDIQPWLKRQLERKTSLSIDVREGLVALERSLRADPGRIGDLARVRAVLVLGELLPSETARAELRRYAVALPTMYAGALARSLSTTDTDQRLLADVQLDIARRAAAIDDFERALGAAADALRSAERSGDQALIAQAAELQADTVARKTAFEGFLRAEAQLAAAPNDPEANRVVGTRLCFTQGRWEKGLGLLAKGPPGPLKDLAAQERSAGQSPEAWTALGDRWRDAAPGLSLAAERQAALERAREWYERALLGSKEPKKAAIEKALAGLGSALPEVDLLKLMDPKQDSVLGDWSLEKGVLKCIAKKPASRLQIPYRAPEQYDLEIVAERVEGADALLVGLANSRLQAVVGLDGWPPGYATGLEMLDRRVANENESTHKGPVFVTGKESRILCRVRRARISVEVDGKPVINWSGDFARLSVRGDYRVPNPRALFIGTWATIYEIRKLTLRPLTAEGKPLR